jgi:hypothetical protein
MKLKLLVKIGEIILGKSMSDDEPRADMFLPLWLLAFSMLLIAGGIALGIYAIISFTLGIVIACIFCLSLGALAYLCWKNQTIVMFENDTFEYTTFLGNKKIYSFNEITAIRYNKDSMTLFVGDGKVHIESSAIITDRLAERINKQLENIYGNLD